MNIERGEHSVAVVFKDIVTGKDGVSHDIGRWMGVLAFAYYHFAEAFQVFYRGTPFDEMHYGTGLGAVMVATGAMLGLKSRTEPDAAN